MSRDRQATNPEPARPPRTITGHGGEPRFATPSPMPAASAPIATGDPAFDSGMALAVAASAQAEAREAKAIGRQIRDEFGTAPSPLYPEGSGALGKIFTALGEQNERAAKDKIEILGRVDVVAGTMAALAREFAEEREGRRVSADQKAAVSTAVAAVTTAEEARRDKARDPLRKVLMAIVITAATMLTSGALLAIGAAISGHWDKAPANQGQQLQQGKP